MTASFTLVTDPATTEALGGRSEWARCRVSRGEASVTFHPTVENALDGVWGPIIPSRLGRAQDERISTVPFADESEALALIADVAASRREDGVPVGFRLPSPTLSFGLELRRGPHGLDVRLSRSLAAELGWTHGDAVDLAMEASGSRFALFRRPGAAALVETVTEDADPMLEIDRTLPSAPSRLLDALGPDWTPVAVETTEGAALVDPRDLPPAPAAAIKPETVPVPAKTPWWPSIWAAALALALAGAVLAGGAKHADGGRDPALSQWGGKSPPAL